MKKLLIAFLFFSSISNAQSHDTLFWQVADTLENGESGTLKHAWGREAIKRIGTVNWISPSGKELQIEIITCYRQITSANGFSDKSILALVKPGGTLIKSYDMVKRINLPVEIVNNELVYDDGTPHHAALPAKFSERFCVEGMTCFSEVDLIHVEE